MIISRISTGNLRNYGLYCAITFVEVTKGQLVGVGGVNICGIKEYLLVSKSYHCSYRLSYDFFFSYQKVPKVKSACSHSKEVDLKI